MLAAAALTNLTTLPALVPLGTLTVSADRRVGMGGGGMVGLHRVTRSAGAVRVATAIGAGSRSRCVGLRSGLELTQWSCMFIPSGARKYGFAVAVIS